MTYRQCLYKMARSRPATRLERLRSEGRHEAVKGALGAFVDHFKNSDSWADWGRSVTRGALGFSEWTQNDRDRATGLHYSDGSMESNTTARKLGSLAVHC